jgi:CTP synthase
MESGIRISLFVELSTSFLKIRNKLALFFVKKEVIQSIDASTIYEVPNLMLEEG